MSSTWLNDAVLYQIFPLGFCGCPHENAPADEPPTAPASPAPIAKIADWAGYLQALGVTAVLLNPVFESDTHGYDTRDLRLIDRRLGTNDDFAAVADALHAHGIRIVLDAVFNHVGRGFWAFRDVRAKKWDSPYKDWFHLSFDGDSAYGDGFWYEGWEGHYELVKLNLQNPAVVDYLLDSVRGWVRDWHVDGLRLDVAYSLDHGFIRRLRELADGLRADGSAPEGLALIGETLHGDYNQLVNDQMLDSCTNYECYKGLYSSFNSVNMFEIAHSLHRQFGGDPWCIYRGLHLMSFADNHDVTRLASILTDPACVRPAYGALFGMPGVPCLYYGSEWGAEGTKGGGDDWALRPAFAEPEPNGLTVFIKRLIEVRTGRVASVGSVGEPAAEGGEAIAATHAGAPLDPADLARASRALTEGGYRNVVIDNRWLLFERAAGGDAVYVAVNAVGETARMGAGELSGEFVDLVTGERAHLDGSLELEPHGVRYLLRA